MSTKRTPEVSALFAARAAHGQGHRETTWRVGIADWSEAGNARYELLGVKTVSAPDARLIAAASDLLAALKEIADGCVSYRPGHVNYSDNRTKEEIRVIADIAIAKATGSAA